LVPKPVRNYMYHHPKGPSTPGLAACNVRSGARPQAGRSFGRPAAAGDARNPLGVVGASGYPQWWPQRHWRGIGTGQAVSSGILRRTGEPPAPTPPHCPLVATNVDTNQVDGTASVMCAAASRVHLAAGEMPLPSALRGPGGSWQKISCIFFLLFLLFPLWYTWLSTQYVSWL
jgi:hypothetical protein